MPPGTLLLFLWSSRKRTGPTTCAAEPFRPSKIVRGATALVNHMADDVPTAAALDIATWINSGACLLVPEWAMHHLNKNLRWGTKKEAAAMVKKRRPRPSTWRASPEGGNPVDDHHVNQDRQHGVPRNLNGQPR